MRRTKPNNKPDAIICSDLHLREDQPVCRTDNFWEAQWHKIAYIAGLQSKYGCLVVCAGDIFHHWKPSPYLLSCAIDFLPYKFHFVMGQHDLPQHNMELRIKCGANVLKTAGVANMLPEAHFGQGPDVGSLFFPSHERTMLVWHKFTWKGKRPWPGCEDPTAKELLKEYPQFDIIVCGDNHRSLVEEYGGRLLLVPGCITRQAADFDDYQPKVWLYYAESNTVEPVSLPIKSGVITREHIDKVTERDERIEAFISRLDKDYKAGVSFDDNLELFLKSNKIRKPVEEVVRKAVDE